MSAKTLNGVNALLLAGGYGTRLRPLTDTIPKCLVSIAGKPLLEHWLDNLFGAGIERVRINTHYLAPLVQDFCESSPYKMGIELVHEPELLGTAGTLKANHDLIEQNTLLLAHADNLTAFNVDHFIQAHRNRAPTCKATMMTFNTDSPSTCGIVEIDAAGVLTGFHEKVANPPGNRANAALFLLEKSCLNWFAKKPDAFDFCRDIIPLGIKEFQTFHNEIYHRDIGTIESLNQANFDFPTLAKKN
jgi:mannose-1-phosphate guanylyltransferase